MSPNVAGLFDFLSSSSLVSQGTGKEPASPITKEPHHDDDEERLLRERIASLRMSRKPSADCLDMSAHSVPSLAPCSNPSSVASDEDDAPSLCLSPNPQARQQQPQLRRLKSILKQTSSYGPANSKNPKSLRRGFQSMMELPTLPLPEEESTSFTAAAAPVVDLAGATPLQSSNSRLDDEDDDDSRFGNGPSMSRSISFSSEGPSLKKVPSLKDMEGTDLWFQKDEISSFAGAELARRRSLGISSQAALCSAVPHYDDDEEEGREAIRRKASANMPRGVRR